MSLPKKRKTNIQIKSENPDRGPALWVEQFVDQNKQFLPRSVNHEDLDGGLVNFIDKDLDLSFDNKVKGGSSLLYFSSLIATKL